MNNLRLMAEPRELFGRRVNKIRLVGQLPAVMYGHGVKNQPLVINQTEFQKVYQQAGKSTLIDVIVGEEATKCLIHDVQFQPVSGQTIHVDLLTVKLTEKITTEIPIKIVNEAPAVKELQGTLIINKDHLKVEALPQDLVHELEVDVSGLRTFDDIIHVKDLNVPTKITVLDDLDEVVVLVQPPRSEEELAELEEKPVEDVEKVEVEEKGQEEESAPVAGEQEPPTTKAT